MNNDSLSYPPTRAEDVTDVLHGLAVRDPYRWLEDADRDEVKEWTARQNALTRSLLDRVPGREQLAARLGVLLEVGYLGAPCPVKGRYFYTHREGKQNQPVLSVREGVRGADR